MGFSSVLLLISNLLDFKIPAFLFLCIRRGSYHGRVPYFLRHSIDFATCCISGICRVFSGGLVCSQILKITFIFLLLFFLRFYLFTHERHRDTGRWRSRLHAGSPTWNSIPGLQDQGRRQSLNCWATQVSLNMYFSLLGNKFVVMAVVFVFSLDMATC